MKKILFLLLVLMISTLVGCSKSEMTGEKPPKVDIHIGEESYETTLGTYCWGNGCVDTVGPVELLEGKEPINVEPGATINFIMDYNPKPNSFHLLQINEGLEYEIKIENDSFTAPTYKGVYYYSYGVWWMDVQKENVSNGDAFYYFSLEIE